MPSYAAPKVVVNPTQQASVLSAGAGLNTILALFTAPQGPDVPFLHNPVQSPSLYGSKAASGSVGYTGPLLLDILGRQQQIARSTPSQILGCRVGVTRASATLGGLTIQGIGAYAGSKGNNLAVQDTVVSSVVTSVSVVDTSNANAVVLTITSSQADLSSWQAIGNAIIGAQPVTNSASVVTVSAINNATAYPGAAVGAPGTSFTGGLDGKTATGTDATIASLLTQSLAYRADYIAAAFDAATVAPAIATHITNAAALNHFRMASLGPAAGTTYTSLSGSYISAFTSGAVQCLGHDLAFMQNPLTGAGGTYDGFYEAAAVAAVKAAGPKRVTCSRNQPLVGFTGFGNTGITGPLSPTQRDALASAGAVVLSQAQGGGAITIRDNITTTPEYPAGSSQVNIFYQASMTDVDNAVRYALAQAVDPYASQARLSSAQDVLGITKAIQQAVNNLGDTVNGYGPNGIQVYIDPATGKPQAAVNLLYPFPYGEIDITPIVSI